MTNVRIELSFSKLHLQLWKYKKVNLIGTGNSPDAFSACFFTTVCLLSLSMFFLGVGGAEVRETSNAGHISNYSVGQIASFPSLLSGCCIVYSSFIEQIV